MGKRVDKETSKRLIKVTKDVDYKGKDRSANKLQSEPDKKSRIKKSENRIENKLLLVDQKNPDISGKSLQESCTQIKTKSDVKENLQNRLDDPKIVSKSSEHKLKTKSSALDRIKDVSVPKDGFASADKISSRSRLLSQSEMEEQYPNLRVVQEEDDDSISIASGCSSTDFSKAHLSSQESLSGPSNIA